MTYFELFHHLKSINKDYYHDEIIYEFLYDDLVLDKLSFLSYKDRKKDNYQYIIDKFTNCINNNIPWERVLGYCYFYNLKIELFNNVFSPRKDTEELVYLVLKETQNKENLVYLDLGTGSGCICVSIAKNIHNSSKVIGYENNYSAYLNTIKNINNHNLNNIDVYEQDYLKLMDNNLLHDFDVLICNPPYISKGYKLDENVINYDPDSALFAENNGLQYYFKIFEYIRNLKNKICYFEIGFDLKEPLIKKLKELNIYSYNVINDMSMNPRILKIIL